MTRIALFHSVLGIRPGIIDAAEVFRGAGHDVLVVDQYDSRSFDDYVDAGEFATGLGFPQALMRSALAAIADDPGPLVAAGFSNVAEYVTAIRGGRTNGSRHSPSRFGRPPSAMRTWTIRAATCSPMPRVARSTTRSPGQRLSAVPWSSSTVWTASGER